MCPSAVVAGFRLVSPPPMGLPVLRRISLYTCRRAITPAGPLGARVAFFPNDGGLPRNSAGSATGKPAPLPGCEACTAR